MLRQTKLHQQDLFAPDRVQRAEGPIWQALPVETRRVLTQLMARLIFDHAAGDRNPESGDAGHHDV
jgi:hypothetical protein